MRSRLLRLALPLAMVGAVFLVPVAGLAQTSCDVSVSASDVTVGQAITITGTGFGRAEAVTLWAGGVQIHTGTANGGVLSTSHSFSAPGTYMVQATAASCNSAQRAVRVSALATTTTTVPRTTTTTLPPDQVVLRTEGECSITVEIPAEQQYGYPLIAAPGTTFTVNGSGFDGEGNPPPVVEVHPQDSTLNLVQGVPGADGTYSFDLTVPDWPEATYWMVVSQQRQDDGCFAVFPMYVDQPQDAEEDGNCSITIMQIKAKPDIPWFMWGQYATYGFDFAPGEMVVLTLANSPGVSPADVIGGPVEAGSDGSFVMPFAPPPHNYGTEGPAEWWAQSRSCIAKTTLGSATAMTGLPPFTVTPGLLSTGGVEIGDGDCDLVVWLERGDAVNGVDPAYQDYPLEENLINAFGTGFTPGEGVSWLLDGQTIPGAIQGGFPVVVDEAGKFQTSEGSHLFALQGAGVNFTLTAVTDSCTTSAAYVGSLLVSLAEGVVGTAPTADGVDHPPSEEAGVGLIPVQCQLAVWKEAGVPVEGVDPKYQEYPEDDGGIVAFGNGFIPFEAVSWLLDGSPLSAADAEDVPEGLTLPPGALPDPILFPLVVDEEGNFYASSSSSLFAAQGAAVPFTLTAQTDSCTASALYTENLQAGVIPSVVGDTPTATGVGGSGDPDGAPDGVQASPGGASDGLSTGEVAVVALVAIAGVGGGVLAGQSLGSRGRGSIFEVEYEPDTAGEEAPERVIGSSWRTFDSDARYDVGLTESEAESAGDSSPAGNDAGGVPGDDPAQEGLKSGYTFTMPEGKPDPDAPPETYYWFPEEGPVPPVDSPGDPGGEGAAHDSSTPSDELPGDSPSDPDGGGRGGED